MRCQVFSDKPESVSKQFNDFVRKLKEKSIEIERTHVTESQGDRGHFVTITVFYKLAGDDHRASGTV